MSADPSSVLLDGPWEHRFVAANGARFHVAEVGEGPCVLLVHGFPQFWWAWRHQLTALAQAGYHAAAVDLRGYGASDKPPRGYDTFTSAADLASVIRSLGETDAVVVGQGWGGWIAWSMASMEPAVTRAVASLAMPHPLVMRHASYVSPAQIRANGYLYGLQRPFVPERAMGRDSRYVERLLHAWASPSSGWPTAPEARRYADAVALPFVAHSAAEYLRWVMRSQLRPDGQRFAARVRRPVGIPVLSVFGADDGAVLRSSTHGSEAYAATSYEEHLIERAGHFLAEEASGEVNRLLLAWLRALP